MQSDYKHSNDGDDTSILNPLLGNSTITSIEEGQTNNDQEHDSFLANPIEMPSFWVRVYNIRQFFFAIYFVELTKAAINASNTSILASTSENDAAAVSFISSTVVFYTVALTAVNFYLPNLLSHNESKQEIIIFYALLTNIILGCISGMISYFTGDFLKQIGTPTNIANIVSDFYFAFAFAVPGIFVFFAWQQICGKLKKQNILYAGCTITTIAAIMWTILSCVYPGNLFPASHAKLTGESYLIGYSLGTLIYLSYFIWNRLLTLPTYHDFIENLHLLKEWLYKGSFYAIHITNELLAVILQAVLVVAQMDCSKSDLALLTVLNFWNLNTVTFAIAMGIATNITMTTVPKCQNRDEIIKAYGNTGLTVCTTLNIAVFALSMIYPSALVSAAGVNRRDIGVDDNMLRLLFIIQNIGLMANSRRDVHPGNLRNSNILKTPMYASFIAQAVGLVLQYSLGVVAKGGVPGLQLGYYGGLALGNAYLECVWARNSQPDIAKENRENPKALAEADSFAGQLREAFRFFKEAVTGCCKSTNTYRRI